MTAAADRLQRRAIMVATGPVSERLAGELGAGLPPGRLAGLVVHEAGHYVAAKVLGLAPAGIAIVTGPDGTGGAVFWGEAPCAAGLGASRADSETLALYHGFRDLEPGLDSETARAAAEVLVREHWRTIRRVAALVLGRCFTGESVTLTTPEIECGLHILEQP